MNGSVYRFAFEKPEAFIQAQAILLLAVEAVEGVHGQAEMRLRGRLDYSKEHQVLLIDGTTTVGHDLARAFTNMVTQALGEDAFRVEAVAAEMRERIVVKPSPSAN